MKPFDLAAAKSGEPVCTADGREVRLYAFDAPTTAGDTPQPIVGVMRFSNWLAASWGLDGQYNSKVISGSDLRMAPRKEVRWVVTWKFGYDLATMCAAYPNKEEAELRVNHLKQDDERRHSFSINAIEVEV